jgi:hypothetical protein
VPLLSTVGLVDQLRYRLQALLPLALI